MKSEIEIRASFDYVRYAMCWEDADVLLSALNLQKDDIVLSIASAGDNSFAMLTYDVKKVYAIDLNISQIACCKLRAAAYTALDYQEFMSFSGVYSACEFRAEIYQNRLRPLLDANTQNYWDERIEIVKSGFMSAGKFENYFKLFGKKILPLIHSKKRIKELIKEKTQSEREIFYNTKWNNLRWKLMFRIFFSRFVMGKLGRDKEFFKYVKGSVAKRILERVKYALTVLDPSLNPYLHYILYGRFIFKTALPFALREENYKKIKENIEKIEFACKPMEEFIETVKEPINAFNLSDIFEYMTSQNMDLLYEMLLENAALGARFVYWNMLAPRKIGFNLAKKYNVKTNEDKNESFLNSDKAFFYSRFYLDTKGEKDA